MTSNNIRDHACTDCIYIDTIYTYSYTFNCPCISQFLSYSKNKVRNYRNMKYKPRFFYSRGALLVLLWIGLFSAVTWCFICYYFTLFKQTVNNSPYYRIALIPLIPLLMCTPLAGWMADMWLGNFTVFKTGVLFNLIASVALSICVLLVSNMEESNAFNVTQNIILYSIIFIAISMFSVTALQLGLDQMPDASSDNIISFIKWVSFSMGFGLWICDSLWNLQKHCIQNLYQKQIAYQIFSLVPVIFSSFILCTIFILSSKYLTFEPRSTKSLSIVYKVLKFAIKNKSPLNRSSFTYWEENIPSRIDLGKSRYGGPFTTEQVEDVKTLFKVIMFQLPLFFCSGTLRLSVFEKHLVIYDLDPCFSALIYVFSFSSFWCVMLVTIISELIVYPLFRKQKTTIIRRIGILCLVIFLSNLVMLLIHLVEFANPALGIAHWFEMVYSAYVGIVGIHFFLTLNIQFICAQSPYHMRGLLAGYGIFTLFLSMGTAVILYRLFINFLLPDSSIKYIIQNAVFTGISLFGFILYCVLAYWYKWRVREEIYSPQIVIEEVYDRYLSQAASNNDK